MCGLVVVECEVDSVVMKVKLHKVSHRSFTNYPSKSKLISELKIAPLEMIHG